jgi:hypothetical protein
MLCSFANAGLLRAYAENGVLKAVTIFKTGRPLKIAMHEPSSPALLTVDLLSAGALVLLLHRETGLGSLEFGFVPQARLFPEPDDPSNLVGQSNWPTTFSGRRHSMRFRKNSRLIYLKCTQNFLILSNFSTKDLGGIYLSTRGPRKNRDVTEMFSEKSTTVYLFLIT